MGVCITRVGRVFEAAGGRAMVEFFDGRILREVDLAVVGARKGEYVDVFGNMALSVLSESEARSRRRAWAVVEKAAQMVHVEAPHR